MIRTGHRWTGQLAIALMAAVLSVSCMAPSDPDATGSALLILGFDSSAQALSLPKPMAIVPDGIAISTVEVELSGPGGARIERSADGSTSLELELSPGAWTIVATGRNADGLVIAEGSLDVLLEPADRQSRVVALRPIAGAGSIDLGWTMIGEVGGTLTVSGGLDGPNGEHRTIESPFARPDGSPLALDGLSSGGWELSLSLLRDGTALCGLADGILVAAGMRTSVSVEFSPPDASLTLGFLVPDYEATSLAVEPAVRRLASGRTCVFKTERSGVSWYVEGIRQVETGSRLLLATEPQSRSWRVDCVKTDEAGLAPPRSGTARAIARPSQAIGDLAWIESLRRSEQGPSWQESARALSDCRDLAWSPSGARLAAAGRNSDCVSLFDAETEGACFPIACLGAAAAPGLEAPSRIRFLAEQRMLALSETAGTVHAIALEGQGEDLRLSLAGSLSDSTLIGAKDLALVPSLPGNLSTSAYIPVQSSDSVILLTLDEDGRPIAIRVVAEPAEGELAAFSRPSCAAVAPSGTLVAVGTAGDDALYLFDRLPDTGDLSLRQRIDASSFPSGAPLSDPVSIAFDEDSDSILVLSYYGRSIVRLDWDDAADSFAPSAGARSGTGVIRGFATPRILCHGRASGIALVAGGGAEDGLAAFDVNGSGKLEYLGCILPPEGDAVPSRPSALAIDPFGLRLALAADGSLSVFSLSIGN